MKKFSQLTLSVLLISALLLAGCGDPAADPSESSAPATEVTTVATAEATTEATTTATQPTETAAAASDEELTPVVLGKLTGLVYENEYTGFGCEFPENWVLAPADVLQELPDAISDMLADTELDTSIPQIMDLYAQDSEQGTSVNVLYTELPPAERIAYMLMDDNTVIDKMLEQKDLLMSSFAQTGLQAQSIEKATVPFLGEDHVVLKTVGSANDMEFCIIQVLNYHLGGKYAVTTTFSGLSEEAVENAMAMFYGLD